MTADARVIARLDAELERVLHDVPRDEPVALLDFPNHNNSGDSAIWLGELVFLARRRARLAYVCETASYHPADLERAYPSGPLLLHGGGNFGDLWPEHQAFRERVLRDLPHRDVVQLPQTACFTDPANLRRLTSLAAGRSGRFLVACRDRDTLELLASAGLETRLSPDMAFALGPLDPVGAPAHDVVVVRRMDHERTGTELAFDDEHDVLVTDWLDARRRRTRRRFTVRTRTLVRSRARGADGPGLLDRSVRRLPVLSHARMAEARTAAALRILSAGKVVVTDRLHGHILSTLLGRPHVLVDDANGKVRRFHETFTADSELAVMVTSGSAVRTAVSRLLDDRA